MPHTYINTQLYLWCDDQTSYKRACHHEQAASAQAELHASSIAGTAKQYSAASTIHKRRMRATI